MVKLFNLGGGVARNRHELVGSLGGSEIGLAKRLNKAFQGEADERIQKAETGIFDVLVVHLPVILGGDMAITDVIIGLHSLRLSTRDRDD